MPRKISLEIISALLILLFVYAAISKLIDYHRFSHFLSRVPFLLPFASQIAWIIPVAELLTALLLTVKATRSTGLYTSFFLMLLFTAYIVLTLTFSSKVPCHCGGVLQGLSWNMHIVFNSFFLILAFIGINLQLKENNYLLKGSDLNVH